MAGRFRTKIEYEIHGTGHRVYLTPLSAIALGEIQSSSFAGLGDDDDGTEATDAKAREALARTAGIIVANCYEDEALTERTFASAEKATEELSAFQLRDLFVAVMRLSSMGPEAVATARRFPDGGGPSGGVDAPSNGGEVRAAAGGSAGG